MSTKYLFLDVDGTIVDFDGTMSESAEAALKAAQKNGHKLILCTGRCTGQLYPMLMEKISFDGFITSAGARVRYGGKVISEKIFSLEQLRRFIKVCHESGTFLYAHIDEGLAATKKDIRGINEVFREIGIDSEAANSLLGKIAPVDSLEMDGIERLIYCGSAYEHEEMRSALGGEFAVDPYSFQNMPNTSGEVNLAGVTKASGIHALISHLGASMDDTIAFGDNWNDISMIRAAKVGVVMGNAPEELKAEADMVTDHIRKDGLYNAFVRLGLI